MNSRNSHHTGAAPAMAGEIRRRSNRIPGAGRMPFRTAIYAEVASLCPVRA